MYITVVYVVLIVFALGGIGGLIVMPPLLDKIGPDGKVGIMGF